MATDRLIQKFDPCYDNASKIVILMKILNDKLQQQGSLSASIAKTLIDESKDEYNRLCADLQPLLSFLERDAIGTTQKTKLKKLKDLNNKESQRNKSIMSNLVEYYYANAPRESTGQIRSTLMKSQSNKSKNDSSYEDNSLSQQPKVESLVPYNQIELDQLIIQEKQGEINELEKDATELNKIVQDVNQEVYKQDAGLDQVQDNQNVVKTNLQETNKELVQAQEYQGSSTKKYVCFALLALLLVGVIIVILYFFH